MWSMFSLKLKPMPKMIPILVVTNTKVVPEGFSPPAKENNNVNNRNSGNLAKIKKFEVSVMQYTTCTLT